MTRTGLKKKHKEWYVGLMSGTSMDAVDVALVSFSPLQLIATHSEPIPFTLKHALLALNSSQENTLVSLGRADTLLGRLFAHSCLQLLKHSPLSPSEVRAIGSHGQTVYHAPHSDAPFTLQIGDPNIIASMTGITTVADFRRRDMALGGQAAPLTPAFHNFLLRHPQENRWILNIGGISNLTFLAADPHQPVVGFDTGPGNTLLDAWCYAHLKKPYDDAGQWSQSGHVYSPLLTACLEDPYFSLPPPKSTGREYFHLTWLTQKMNAWPDLSPQDVQATLVELTAVSISRAIQSLPATPGSLWMCGGGIYNKALIERIMTLCHPHRIMYTDAVGIPPKWIEAVSFAWLAQQTLEGKPGNLPSVTGARALTILGRSEEHTS